MRRHAAWMALLWGACAEPSPLPAPAPAAPPPVTERAAAMPEPEPVAAPPAPARVPVAAVDDPAALAEVAAAGGGLEALLGADGVDAVTALVRRDLADLARRDPKAGVGVRGNPHRLFDARWLDSGRHELVGVTYRADRVHADPARCGDVRLIYRLAYTTAVGGTEVSSRLPMTTALVLRTDERGATRCAREAERWMAPEAVASAGGAALGRWLVEGPLRDRLAAARLEQVLINLQAVRWPSSVRPDLGGHAEYLLRKLVPDEVGRLVVAPLDNTPDVPRLRRDRRLRARLLAWLREPETVRAIDAGTAALPAELCAEKVVSVSPRGLSRRGNRLFRQLVAPEELAGVSFEELALVDSPAGLLRRLDEMTCAGCHQGRSLAGFHWLGVDGPEVVAGNALVVHQSPPLWNDLARRAAIVEALAAGAEPSAMPPRPFTERAPEEGGGVGAACGLGDATFAGWGCDDGLVCDRYDAPPGEDEVGLCVSPAARAVGEPCEVAPVRPHPDPHRDRVRGPVTRSACEGGVCNGNRVGFPGGMCTSSCSDPGEHGVCGEIAILGPFNDCLAQQRPFPECLREHIAPAGRRRCDARTPCRNDYLCARTSAGDGACIPPYFLFQLRVDGHSVP